MKPIHLRFIGLALMVAGIVLFGLGTRKTISLRVDGQTRTLTTSAFTVGGLLRAAGLSLASGDQITPGINHWLKSGDIVQLNRASQVLVTADGISRRLITLERLPANLLAQTGVRLFPGDQVLVDGLPVAADEPISPSATHSIQMHRAVQIAFHSGEQQQTFYAATATLGEALADKGIEIHASDRITPTLETPLYEASREPLQVSLVRSQPVNIYFKGGQVRIRTAASTVGAALEDAGLSLQGLDYSQPAASEPLPVDGQIRLVRVQERVKLEQEPTPFETQMQPAPDVELDQRKVLQAGEFGLTARSVRIRYEDGKEVSRQVEDQWTLREPKARILGYGTKVVVRTLNTPDGPIKYWRAVQMYATSYSPCRIFKDRCDSYTASGATLKKGIVAMTGTWYRYSGGDQVYVPGYGVGTVADTGGGIPGRYWLDLGYSEEDYVSWHQNVTVYFLAPIPANIMWVLP
jgi:resuscitation-promoting factor RpfB